ncbi:hypothetical protein K435DRAFT_771708 [Dendrothele bispora CBS 962.96]|uniref:Uncharacterized protein n=1 Tax=Dendrothele bispora (strain CBS 962.96) TaxID=1314807 RepID=A0A4S8MZE2_DENBC|nr:hypothetical protein K435DRAFT_771708 [Dendrothele bispora CBS 962.96]
MPSAGISPKVLYRESPANPRPPVNPESNQTLTPTDPSMWAPKLQLATNNVCEQEIQL